MLNQASVLLRSFEEQSGPPGGQLGGQKGDLGGHHSRFEEQTGLLEEPKPPPKSNSGDESCLNYFSGPSREHLGLFREQAEILGLQ